jgi:hypothetical protein
LIKFSGYKGKLEFYSHQEQDIQEGTGAYFDSHASIYTDRLAEIAS